MFKKFFLTLLLAALAPAAAFASLPEIEGWTNGELRETKLDAVSGPHGTWLEREYRTTAGTRLNAVWMEGAGPKLWRPVTEVGEEGDFSGGESAEKISVAGLDAVLESRPVLGLSLVVKIGKDAVLTLESQYAGAEELTAAAETIIKKIKR